MKKYLQATIAAAITILTIVLGFIGFDTHYTTRSYHDLCYAGMEQKIQSIQQTNMIQRAQDELFYWQREERDVLNRLRRIPQDKYLNEQLRDIRENRKRAEDRLRMLQGR